MTGIATHPAPAGASAGLFNAGRAGEDPWSLLAANATLPAGRRLVLDLDGAVRSHVDPAAPAGAVHGPPAPLDALAAASAWAVQPDDTGGGLVSLRARGRCLDAHVRHDAGGPSASIEIERRREAPAPACARAAAWLLLATTGRVRHVRAAARDAAGGGFELRLEAACSGDADLDAALEALAAAGHLCIPETLQLLDDEELATRCLAQWPPVASPSTP